MTDDDVNDVERFIRTDLITTIEIEPKQYKFFFGEYSKIPEQFRFDDEERSTISKLIESVKYNLKTIGAHHYLCNENVERIIKNNVSIGWFFEDVANSKICVDSSTQTVNHESQVHFVLDKLLETANQNFVRKPEGYRYDKHIRNWATYFRMLCGPMAYDTIQRNFECAIPSLSSTNRYIRKNNQRISEGVVRSQELLQYLRDRNLPLVVSLSEDGTKITSKVQYDPFINELVGFVLPIDDATGMPISGVYKARNIEEICEHFSRENPVGDNANVIMAQPIVEGVPPFCLLIFGTDGKYSGNHVQKRWQYISNELKKLEIKVVTVASDSDSRYNSAMRSISSLGQKSNIFSNANWFSADESPSLLCFQDTPHIMSKMRNRFLRTIRNPKLMPLGPHDFVQVQHLQYLLDHCRKDEHLLTQSAITPTDKQNIQSINSIIHPRVTHLMTERVPTSRATVVFLQTMRAINDSFLDKSLSPVCRIRLIWRSLFFLRIWGSYIRSKKGCTLRKNFITTNCLSCIELNAHTMILLIMQLRDNDLSDFFKLNLMDSQPCESFFRRIRSLTTTNSTVVTFSLKEMLGRINRITLQYDIANDSNTGFVYSRKKKIAEHLPVYELPSNDDIFHEIQQAKNEAICIANSFGLIKRSVSLELVTKSTFTPMKSSKSNPITENESDDDMWEYEPIKYNFSRVYLRNYSDKFENIEIEESSSYVEIYRTFERRRVVKKTSICWLLRKDTLKLSSDRLVRVQGPKEAKTRKKPKHKKKIKIKASCKVKPTLYKK